MPPAQQLSACHFQNSAAALSRQLQPLSLPAQRLDHAKAQVEVPLKGQEGAGDVPAEAVVSSPARSASRGTPSVISPERRVGSASTCASYQTQPHKL